MVAVIADVHSNLPALETVMEEIGGEEILFCGDLVGYYTWPGEVIELARKEDFVGIKGNHDAAVIEENTFGFGGEAGIAIDWTIRHTSGKDTAYLESLPRSRREDMKGREILMVHGSPREPLREYIYPEQVDEGFLRRNKVNADILVMGHTHVPFVKEVGDVLVLNPGSVGQPRDGDPRASHALLDPENLEAEIQRTSYDIDRVQEEVRERDLPETLASRLREGR